MRFTTDDEMVGQRVAFYTGHGDEETGTVVAVGIDTDHIKVKADEDGETLTGNQWEPLD